MDNIINIIIKKKIFRLGLPIRKWIHMFYGKIRNVLTLCLLKEHAMNFGLKACSKDIVALYPQFPLALVLRQTSFNNALYFQKQHKMRQNTITIHRGVMEIEEESGHVWHYVQRDGVQKRALMQLQDSFPSLIH